MPASFEIDFSEGGNSDRFLGDGWSHQEPWARWAIGRESTVILPDLPSEGAYALTLLCLPHLNPFRSAQRVVLFLNGIEIGREVVRAVQFSPVDFNIPAGLVSTEGSGNIIRIYHPDASIPADFEGGDIRDLSVYVRTMTFTPKLDAPPNPPSFEAISDIELMKRFVSLGDNCEFGLVQRKWGAEPPSLLRFSAIGLPGLIRGLEEGFAAVGDDVKIKVDIGNEFMVFDATYDFRFHTFIYEGESEKILVEMARRLKFLKRKFVEDLGGRSKIFVFRQTDECSQEDIDRLVAELNRSGENILLLVALANSSDLGGTIDVVSDRLIRGYISKFKPLHEGIEICYDEWLAICRMSFDQATKVGYFSP